MKPKKNDIANPTEESTAKYLKRLSERIGDRDLFPEKTARARKFLKELRESHQSLTH